MEQASPTHYYPQTPSPASLRTTSFPYTSTSYQSGSDRIEGKGQQKRDFQKKKNQWMGNMEERP